MKKAGVCVVRYRTFGYAAPRVGFYHPPEKIE